MASKKIPIEIDINTRDAQKSVRDLNKTIGDTEKDLDEAESAGKQFARGLTQAAEEIETAFRDSERMAEQLASALGPEFAAKIGNNGMDTLVANMRGAGLTSDDLEADIDQVAAAIKRLDTVGDSIGGPQRGLASIDESAKKVEGTSRAASTAIGGIGNSVTELPGVGAALGPVAESLGMLAENALEGDANTKQLVGALGVMGGTAAVMWGVGKAMQSIADTKAFNKAQVEGFRDALKETGSAAAAVLETIKQADGIKGRAGGVFGLFEGTKDITASLVEAKVSADEFIKAVTPGPEAAAANAALTEKLREQKAALEDQLLAMQASGDFSPELNNRIGLLGDAIEITKETLINNTKAVDDNVVSQEFLKTATDNVATATQGSSTRADEYVDSLLAQKAATDEAREADEALKRQLDDRGSWLDLLDTFDQTELAGAEAWLAVSTGAADADAVARDYEQSVIANKEAVIDYAEQVGGIPDEALTNILAMIDQGDLAGAQLALDNLANPGGKPRNAFIKTTVQGRGMPAFADGTDFAPGGPALVGEDGPEIVNLRRGSTVTPAGPTAAILAAGGGASNVTVNVNLHGGVINQQFVRELAPMLTKVIKESQ